VALPQDEAELVEKALIIERTHWTMDYIESMDFIEYRRLVAVFEGLDRGRKKQASKKKRS
jgi:sialic acid synthase SpsE